MASGTRQRDGRGGRRHVVLLLVGGVDRRILPALRFVSRLPATEIRAVHVAVDSADTRRLAADWMRLGLTWIPLHIHEGADTDVPEAVRQLVERDVEAGDGVTVVVPELEANHWWHALLHRRSGRRIAHELQAVPEVTTVIVPFTTVGR